MDTKCNFPNGKYKSNEFNLNDTSEDESLLRQPLRTSYSGFREAKKAYENGTEEVRRLLMQECSLIYECNVCRNMFRSLANFISHKRNYCKMTTVDNFKSFSDHNSSVLIQTIERPEPWLNKSRSMGSSPVPNTKSSNRDLSKVIERLKRSDVSSECNGNKTLLENKIQPSSAEPKAPDPVLELEHVSTTSQAVYQTLKTLNDSDSIKVEVDEVHNLLRNQNTLLGPDGKVIHNQTFIPSTTALSINSNDLDDNNFEHNGLAISCEICKMPFQTEKTLKMHVQKKHTSSTYVFQCPTCSLTFLQPAAVIRHLTNEHKKPLRRIRKMRDTILKKRIQVGDVQVRGPSREVERLKLNNTKDFNDCNNMLEQQNRKPVSTCMYCNKNFERRAVLATHLSNCIERKTLSLLKTSKANISKAQIKQTKIHNQITSQILQLDNQNVDQSEIKVNIKQEPQEPQEDFNSTKISTINEMFENLEKQTFGSGLQTVSLEKLEIMIETNTNDDCTPEREEVENKSSVNSGDGNRTNDDKPTEDNKAVNGEKKIKTKRFRVMPATKQLTCRCKICNKQFNALSNLRRHISMFHYRSRRFGCNLCDYRAFRRYDIVNHLTFVHKMTGERESMAVEYVTVHETKYSKDDVDGDIVVVNEEAIKIDQLHSMQHQQSIEENRCFSQEVALKTYEKREKRKNILIPSNSDQNQGQSSKMDTVASKSLSHIKVMRKRFKKSSVQQVESQKRPIRNRIKAVNKDFVYDLLTLKEEEPVEETSRLALKRRNTMLVDQKNISSIELAPPIKVTPYRLRTEPLIPASKNVIIGFAANIYRNVIHEALAAPSTLPQLPTERPQMRSRLISSSRSDSNPVPIIETSELEAAHLKSTFFDDSFLEKFAKKSNPSFRMKPLLTLQHSPLNSILQKFDTTVQNNVNKQTDLDNNSDRTEDNSFLKPLNTADNSPPSYTLTETDITPNGKHILEPSSPPSTPKKRVTLMQRLAENRAKRRDSLLRTALEN